MDSVSLRFAIAKFQKLDDGRMLIEGTATDETLDSQGDILDYEGSKKAFGDWRGNVREAHDVHKMVGKSLEISFDDVAKAIGVKAFISSGASDTQAKVQEGVLSCFSVGGGLPTKVKTEKVNGRTVRRVLEWPMSELSVVDAGANPNATFQLVKADGVATEILAEDAIVDAANRFAAALMKAIPAPVEKAKKADNEKKPDEKKPDEKKQPAEKKPDGKKPEGDGEKKPAEGDGKDGEPEKCEKCDTVHKDGVAECDKLELAAADTARAKKGVEEAKAAHKVAQAKETLAGAKAKHEAIKAGGEKPKEPEADAAEKAAQVELTKAEAELVEAAKGTPVRKSPQEMDLGDAVQILSSVRQLRAVEASEGDPADAAQVALLDAACDNVLQFIALEAKEPGDDAGDMAPLAASAKTSQAVFLKAVFEEIKKSKTGEAPFTPDNGDQLAEGIGQGLEKTRESISKAISELKVDFDEFKAGREKVDVEKALGESPLLKKMADDLATIAKQPAVPAPLRTVPRDQPSRRNPNNEVAVLEKALASTTHPETMVHLRQQIAIAKAMPRE